MIKTAAAVRAACTGSVTTGDTSTKGGTTGGALCGGGGNYSMPSVNASAGFGCTVTTSDIVNMYSATLCRRPAARRLPDQLKSTHLAAF